MCGRWVRRLVSLALVICVGSCRKGMEDDRIPLAPPRVLPSPAPTSPIERGIDAVPDWDHIRLEWIVGGESDLAGYEIYRREDHRLADTLLAVLQMEEIEKVPPDTAFWVDEGISLQVRYAYMLRAFDRNGHRSDPSESVDYMLLPKGIPEAPQSNIAEGTPTLAFYWGDDSAAAVQFVVKVTTLDGQYLWISDPVANPRQQYDGELERIRYNADGGARMDPLAPGEYRWRMDSIGAQPRSGSESRWVSFRVR